MKIMALDVGDNRIGLAIADYELRIAVPFNVIEKRRSDFFEYLNNVIKEHDIGKLIVGFPKMLDSEVGEQAEKVIAFVEELKKRIEIEIVLWDERYTTVEAHKILKKLYKRRKIREVIDANAAMLILQSYLDCEYK